jgi:phage pi2 protein 07
MNKEEAKRVLEIMALADGGCIYCGSELFNQFVIEFPEFTDIAKEIFKNKFDDEHESMKHKEEVE